MNRVKLSILGKSLAQDVKWHTDEKLFRHLMQHVERKMLDGKSEILYENILLDWVFSFWCPGHKNFT